MPKPQKKKSATKAGLAATAVGAALVGAYTLTSTEETTNPQNTIEIVDEVDKGSPKKGDELFIPPLPLAEESDSGLELAEQPRDRKSYKVTFNKSCPEPDLKSLCPKPDLDKICPKPQIIEVPKIIEKPVEKIVERIVEKPVEKIIEVPVEKECTESINNYSCSWVEYEGVEYGELEISNNSIIIREKDGYTLIPDKDLVEQVKTIIKSNGY